MDWQAWFQLALAAIGTVNPATAALVAMVGNSVATIQVATAEDKALVDQWFAFCQKIVDENRAPTAEEHAAAKAFEEQQHAAVQAA